MSADVVEYHPCPALTAAENAIARKHHYESEVLRLQALTLSNAFKGKSNV